MGYLHVDQKTFLFTPKPKQLLDPLPRNLLYPFYVYGKQDE